MQWPDNALQRVLLAAGLDPEDPSVQEVLVEQEGILLEEAKELHKGMTQKQLHSAVRAIAPVVLPLRVAARHKKLVEERKAAAEEEAWSGPLTEGG